MCWGGVIHPPCRLSYSLSSFTPMLGRSRGSSYPPLHLYSKEVERLSAELMSPTAPRDVHE